MSVKEGREGFTFGCDPEVFIVNDKGEYVSAAGLSPGTKAEPHRIGNIAVQVDGMAAEFNIDPVVTFADFNRRIEEALATLRAFLPTGHDLAIVPAVVFSEEAFNSAPDEAKALGCDPDFDAWSGDVFPPPGMMENPFMRCAGGHLHIGWKGLGEDFDLGDSQHILNCRDMAKQLDWHIGAYSVRIDNDPTRRRLYGKAGAYRPKPYGVEYRTLSNFWITSRDRRLQIWNRMQEAIRNMRDKFYPELYPNANSIVIQSINDTQRNSFLEETFYRPIVSVGSRF
jgi:hypothetical protein